MEKFPFNNTSMKNRRRELRNNSTEAERKLWEYLRGKRLNGFKFYRQYSVGPYIVDFYCSKIRLAIEIDGDQHNEPENKNYDNERSKYLESFNIHLIRFWNKDINNIEDILNKITSKISECSPPPSLKLREGTGMS